VYTMLSRKVQLVVILALLDILHVKMSGVDTAPTARAVTQSPHVLLPAVTKVLDSLTLVPLKSVYVMPENTDVVRLVQLVYTRNMATALNVPHDLFLTRRKKENGS
jgi:hypothetical protein